MYGTSSYHPGALISPKGSSTIKRTRPTFCYNELKVLKEISLLNKGQSVKKLASIDVDKLVAPSHSKNIKSVRLPPISINSSIEDPPGLHYNQSLPVLPSNETKGHERNPALGQIPIQIKNCVSRCSYKTRTGSINGIEKSCNQDSYIIAPHLKGVKGQYLFAVCDGHGESGHLVSSMIKNLLPKALETYLTTPTLDSQSAKVSKAFRKVVKQTIHSKIDTEYSGSTFTGVFISGNSLLSINVGDSRTILGSKAGKWEARQLTNDHKPTRPDEAERIIKAGGRIESTESGPLRIWSNKDGSPGLAMSRSIGDKASCEAGVISEPEIIEYKLSNDDKFIVIASDGVWDVITNEEVVEIIVDTAKTGKSEACCDAVMNEALKRWTKVSPAIDDITVIVVFVNAKN